MVICRACLTSKGMLTNLLNNPNLVQSFFNLTTILVEPDDKLPKSLCAPCLTLLQDFSKFRDKVIQNHHFMLQNIPEPSSAAVLPENQSSSDHSLLGPNPPSYSDKDQSNIDINRPIETDNSGQSINMDTSVVKIKTEPIEDEQNEDSLQENDADNGVIDSGHINIDIQQVNIKSEPGDNEHNVAKEYLIEINIKQEFPSNSDEQEMENVYAKEFDEIKKDETKTDETKVTETETRLRKRKKPSDNEESKVKKQKTGGATKKKGSSRAGKSGSSTRKTVYTEMDRENIITIKLSKEEQLSRQLKESENPKYTSMPFKCTKCFKGYLYERKLTAHIEKFHKDDHSACNSEMSSPCVERLLHDTQSSDSSQSVDSNDALRKERNQRYRDRHREELNQRRRDNRVNRQPIASRSNMHSIQPIQHDEVTSKQVDKKTLRKERDRRYRERHREEINQRRRENRQRRQNAQRPNSEFECYICSRTMVNSASLEQHLKKHATVFQCKACDIIFPEKERAIVHYKTVHEGDVTQYPCQDCGKNFTNRRTLLSHIRNHHLPSEKPRCDICDKSFVTKATYETHMVIHTGELNYSCNICDKRFRLPDGLRSHLTIHTDDQPFYCSQCNVGFKRRDTYKQHFLTTLAHATHEIMDKHRCKTCGRKFATAYGLRKHLTLHDDTRYTCDVCGASVPMSGKRYHRHDDDGDEERVVCDHCGRGFKTRPILKKHIVTVHGAVRPFVCRVCGVKFSQSCSLRNHLIRRHKAPEDIPDEYEPGTSS